MSTCTRMREALRSAHGPLCDACLSAAIGGGDRGQAREARAGVAEHGARMAESGAIIRARGVCSGCGRRETVNGVPLGDGTAIGRLAAAAGGLAEADELSDAEEARGLGRDLQEALRADVQQLEPGLRIVDDGRARATDAGRVDITAQDADGRTVLIELAPGTAAPAALTRLLAHLGAMAGQEDAPVRGLLVAGDFHPDVVLAVRTLPNVELRRYRCRFSFEADE